VRRRILLAILGTVAIALLLAGVGTWFLLRAQAPATAERTLRSQAEGVAGLVSATVNRSALSRNRIAIQRLRQGLRLADAAVVVVGPAGRVRGQLPAGVVASDLDGPRLLDGATLSGHDGDLAWAAAAEPQGNGAIVAVLTREVATPRAPIGWFAVAAGITLVLGAGIAAWLSSSLTRPLRSAERATRRIAAGDLTGRLPEPRPGADDEVADLTRSINAMTEHLDRSRGLERQFLLSVSHDLRTPLTSIRGYAEAISDGKTDPAVAAEVIQTEARRLERLVGDLLDLARLEANQFSLHLATLVVEEVVTDTAEGWRPHAESLGLALHVDDDPTHSRARIDPDRLAQVVANLVENALKFAATAVWVRTDRTDGGVAVAVVDDGPGIDASDLSHVFERLYVARHRPRPTESGSGLGLAIVRELVGAMGGTVSAESPVLPGDLGTRLVVTLPLAESTPADSGTAES
jgi:signal transduction histidine kinase